MVDPRRLGLLSVLRTTVIRHGDDDDLPAFCFTPEPGGDPMAVYAGESEIQQDEIRPPGRCDLDRSISVADDHNVVREQGKSSAQALRRIFIVLDDQDARTHSERIGSWDYRTIPRGAPGI
jgi:hypothetical protein